MLIVTPFLKGLTILLTYYTCVDLAPVTIRSTWITFSSAWYLLSFNFKWIVVIFIYLSYIPNLIEDYQIKFNALQSSILYTYILRQIATHKTYMVFEVIVQWRVKNYMSKSTLKKKVIFEQASPSISFFYRFLYIIYNPKM